MIPKVGRNITDPQPPPWIPVIVVRTDVLPQPFRMTSVPLFLLSQNCLRTGTRTITQQINAIAVSKNIPRPASHRAVEAVHCLLDPAHTLERAPEMAIRLRVFRIHRNR